MLIHFILRRFLNRLKRAQLPNSDQSLIFETRRFSSGFISILFFVLSSLLLNSEAILIFRLHRELSKVYSKQNYLRTSRSRVRLKI